MRGGWGLTKLKFEGDVMGCSGDGWTLMARSGLKHVVGLVALLGDERENSGRLTRCSLWGFGSLSADSRL